VESITLNNRKTFKKRIVGFVCLLSIIVLFPHCTNVNQPDDTDTTNNIWLVSISPEQNVLLTTKDTLRIEIGYRFDPAKINTNDTLFSFYMIVKKNDSNTGDPFFDYTSVNCCRKDNYGWSDTLLLEYPVAEIIKSNPQTKPLTFSFEMITGSDCKDKSGICMISTIAQEYYMFNEGVVVP
jgi:hypothetical protein